MLRLRFGLVPLGLLAAAPPVPETMVRTLVGLVGLDDDPPPPPPTIVVDELLLGPSMSATMHGAAVAPAAAAAATADVEDGAIVRGRGLRW